MADGRANTPPSPLPIYLSMSLPAASAALAVVFTNPFDVSKTRLQLQGEMMRTAAKSTGALPQRYYNGVVDCIVKTARYEGIRGIHKGLSAALLREMSMHSIRTGLFEPVCALLHGADNTEPAPLRTRLLAGAITGISAGFVCNPFELLRTRLQSQGAGSGVQVTHGKTLAAQGHQHGYSSLRHAVISMWDTEGIRGGWKGAGPAMVRLGIGSAVQMSTYTLLKERWTSPTTLEAHGIGGPSADTPITHVACSLVSTLLAVLAHNPLDVVRTRLYNQPFDSSGKGKQYSNALDTFVKVVKLEGPLALYKGVVPHYLRLGPHLALVFLILEQLKKKARERHS